jgi:hypothetical protein
MTASVHGHGATLAIAPASHHQSPICHHAARPSAQPMSDSGACSAAPCLYDGLTP